MEGTSYCTAGELRCLVEKGGMATKGDAACAGSDRRGV